MRCSPQRTEGCREEISPRWHLTLNLAMKSGGGVATCFTSRVEGPNSSLEATPKSGIGLRP